MQIAPGHYPNLSNEAYHADPALGSSGLKTFLELPAQYYADYLDPNNPKNDDDGEDEKETKAKRNGTLAHMAVLEPDLFRTSTLIFPDVTAKNKTVAGWKTFSKEAKSEKKIPLLQKEMAEYLLMADAVKAHPLVGNLLKFGRKEHSFFIQDEATGLMLKSRPDILCELGTEKPLIYNADYKTSTPSLDTYTQSKENEKWERYRQAAFHRYVTEKCLGIKIDHMLNIIQSTKYPYFVDVFTFDRSEMEAEDGSVIIKEDMLEIGMNEVREGLEAFAACKQAHLWPSYSTKIKTYEARDWWKPDGVQRAQQIKLMLTNRLEEQENE